VFSDQHKPFDRAANAARREGARGEREPARALSLGRFRRNLMGIPNDSVTQNEIAEKRRQEAREERREEQRRKAEKLLERGLEDSFPASDPPSITQPAPALHHRKR
jgi:hypothetical protein